MSYTIIHEYRCDGCNRVTRYPMEVLVMNRVEQVTIPGFAYVGDRIYCDNCLELAKPKLEDIQDELRTKYGL